MSDIEFLRQKVKNAYSVLAAEDNSVANSDPINEILTYINQIYTKKGRFNNIKNYGKDFVLSEKDLIDVKHNLLFKTPPKSQRSMIFEKPLPEPMVIATPEAKNSSSYQYKTSDLQKMDKNELSELYKLLLNKESKTKIKSIMINEILKFQNEPKIERNESIDWGIDEKYKSPKKSSEVPKNLNEYKWDNSVNIESNKIMLSSLKTPKENEKYLTLEDNETSDHEYDERQESDSDEDWAQNPDEK